MIKPYSTDTIRTEFSDNTTAWVLQDKITNLYVYAEHIEYPGKLIIHIFISRKDAELLLLELNDVNKMLSKREIYPIEVKLLSFISGIEDGKDNMWTADGYAVHSPNEVSEYIEWINQ